MQELHLDMPGIDPLRSNPAADAVVDAVAERKVICLKGLIARSPSNLIKFIPNIEDPMRYYLIPRADIYYKISIDIPPFGKGLMIWANSQNIRLAEPAKPLRPQTVSATNAKKEEAAGDLICPNCQYINKPGGLICEKCGLVFNAFYQ